MLPQSGFAEDDDSRAYCARHGEWSRVPLIDGAIVIEAGQRLDSFLIPSH